MSTTERHYYRGKLVRNARRPRHTLTVRYSPPTVTPRPRQESVEQQIACAKATAAGYRRLAAMGGRPVRVIQMTALAEQWEARVQKLETRRRGRQQEGELFTTGEHQP